MTDKLAALPNCRPNLLAGQPTLPRTESLYRRSVRSEQVERESGIRGAAAWPRRLHHDNSERSVGQARETSCEADEPRCACRAGGSARLGCAGAGRCRILAVAERTARRARGGGGCCADTACGGGGGGSGGCRGTSANWRGCCFGSEMGSGLISKTLGTCMACIERQEPESIKRTSESDAVDLCGCLRGELPGHSRQAVQARRQMQDMIISQ